jgi:hypothetical protein
MNWIACPLGRGIEKLLRAGMPLQNRCSDSRLARDRQLRLSFINTTQSKNLRQCLRVWKSKKEDEEGNLPSNLQEVV